MIGLHRDAKHFYSWNGGPSVPGITTAKDALKQAWAIPWASRETAKSAVRLHSMVGGMLDEFPLPEDKAAKESALTRHPAVMMLKGMPGRQRDAAAEAGTLVHKIAEDAALGKTPTIPAHLSGFAQAFQRDFIEKYSPVFHPLYVEAMVYHSGDDGVVLPYGGTMDAFVQIDGVAWLIDYKTTSDKVPGTGPRDFPYTDTALQLAAGRFAQFIGRPDDPKKYAMPKVERCGVVAITGTEAALIEYSVTPREFQAFAAARMAWDWVNKRSKEVKGAV